MRLVYSLMKGVPVSDSFLHMTLPWWEFVVRAAIVYFAVMLMLRASGKRAVGQFTPFDMVLLILVGNAVQNGMNAGDNSLPAALLLMVTLIAINYLVAMVSARSRRIHDLVEGVPVVLARDGRLFRNALQREHISEEDFKEALRQESDDAEITRVRYAMLETNGKISFVLREVEEEGGAFPKHKPPPSART